MKKTTLMAYVMAMAAIVACHDAKHDDHDHDEHAGEEHVDQGRHVEGEEHAGEIVLPAAKAKAAGVVAGKLEPGEFQTVIKTSAALQSALGDEQTVTATMAGIVRLGRPLPEGMSVKSGQTLLTISSEHMQDGDPADRAGVNYATAKAEYERAEKLVKDKIISEKDFNVIKQNYELARIAAEALVKGDGSKGVSVVAPLTGYVRECLVKDGDYVSAGQPLLSITRNRRLYLVADVPVRYAAELARVTTARFATESGGRLYEMSELNGRLVAYGRTATAGSSYVPLTFELNATDGLLPGMAATAYLVTGTREGVLSVPESALTEEEGTKYVYVKLDDDCYAKREVRTGGSDGVRRELLGGVKPGENVVMKGAIHVKLASASNAIPAHTHSH